MLPSFVEKPWSQSTAHRRKRLAQAQGHGLALVEALRRALTMKEMLGHRLAPPEVKKSDRRQQKAMHPGLVQAWMKKSVRKHAPVVIFPLPGPEAKIPLLALMHDLVLSGWLRFVPSAA